MAGESNQRRALIWAAVSSKVQAADDKFSLEDQVRLGKEVAARLGAEVIDVLVVPGFSRNYYTLEEVAAAAEDSEVQAFRDLQRHIRRRSFDTFIYADADRFGRKQSLIHEVIGRITDDVGASLFSLTDGAISGDNVDLYAMFKATQSRAEIKKLVARRKGGMMRRAERGLKLGNKPPFGFMEVRDAAGKVVRLQPDPSLARLMEDVAAVVLDGVGWQKVESELFARYGHGNDGKPYPSMKFRKVLLSPQTWGHMAYNWNNPDNPHGQSLGAWVFDVDEPVPPSVTMYRSTHAPLYSGRLAEHLKAELRRRTTLRGNTRPDHTEPFAGLLVCAECLCNMVMARNRKYRGYRCASRYKKNAPREMCPARKGINENVVRTHFHVVIADMLATHSLGNFGGDEQDSLQRRRAQLTTEITDTETQMKRLVTAIRTVPNDNPAWAMYTDEMTALGGQLKRLNTLLEDAERTLRQADTRDQLQALEDIRAIGLDNFWHKPTTTINQTLRRLAGRYRFAVENGKIEHVILAPKPFRRPPRRV